MTNRRTFLKTAGAGITGAGLSLLKTAGVGLAGAGLSLRGATRPPNIVCILADDLGWGDLRCYQPESYIPTPHLDQVASEGMRFTDMHSPSAVCTPTRYGVVTGRYCWRSRLKNGVLNGYSPNLIEPGRMTVASMLKRAGYYTGCVGKWHLGLGSDQKTDYSKVLRPGPNDHGFDYFFGIPASLDMAPYLYVENDKPVEQPTAHTPGNGGSNPIGPFWREGPISPSLKIEEVLPTLTSKSVEFIRERAKKPDQPFFLYFPLTGPHTPWVPTGPFQGKSRAGEYGDFVAQVDGTVAQIVRALKQAGAEQNTLLIFTSDNGPYWPPELIQQFKHRSAANWRGMKADIFEGGHRIPFLARWPGKIQAGSVSDELGCLTDLMATAADINGIKLPKEAGEDSYSLLPAMLGRKGPPIREAVVHHAARGMFSIRQGQWKLILGRGSGGFTKPQLIEPKPGEPMGELYDVIRDPRETRDLYREHPDVVARLTALLDKYRSQGYSRPMAG